MVTTYILALPDSSNIFIVETDASDHGISAIESTRETHCLLKQGHWTLQKGVVNILQRNACDHGGSQNMATIFAGSEVPNPN
jgi:hypothetical protein